MNKMNRRAMSFLLALAMILSMIPSNVFTVFAEDEVTGGDTTGTTEQETAKNEYEANVGKQAVFDWWDKFLLVDDPTRADISDIYATDTNTAHIDGEHYWYFYEEEFEKSSDVDENGNPIYVSTGEPFIDANEIVMKIVDFYYDDANGWYWYKVDSKDLPEKVQNKPWILYRTDFDMELGFEDPYLCIYDADEVIQFVTSETITVIYMRDENDEIVNDDNGNPIVLKTDTLINHYVISGPSALENAKININTIDSYPVSALSYMEDTYSTTFSKGFTVSINKANGTAWTPEDGMVSIRYEMTQFGTDSYTGDVYFGAAFLYIEDSVYSADATERDYDISDVVYTNTALSTLVFEHMPTDFLELNYKGYYTTEQVNVYNNTLSAYTTITATEFVKVLYSFTQLIYTQVEREVEKTDEAGNPVVDENGDPVMETVIETVVDQQIPWYWIERDGQYFLVRQESITFESEEVIDTKFVFKSWVVEVDVYSDPELYPNEYKLVDITLFDGVYKVSGSYYDEEYQMLFYRLECCEHFTWPEGYEEYRYVPADLLEETDQGIAHPIVDFTNPAPIAEAPVTPRVRMRSVPGAALQTFGLTRAADSSNDALKMEKDVKDNGNGTYTITLEAYTTGTVKVTQVSMPMDIVLVLDQSGSMEYCIGCGDTNVSANDTHTEYVVATNVSTSGTYYRYSGSAYERLYYCSTCKAWLTSQSHSGSWGGGGHQNLQKYQPQDTTFYTATEVRCKTRLDALKDAVTAFVAEVNEKAKGEDGIYGPNADGDTDDVKHRIAIVGFASQSGYGNNTEILSITGNNSGSVGVKYDDLDADDYAKALQDVTTESGRTMLSNAIDALAAQGATQSNLGMKMAENIYANNALQDTRNRVTIMFTDGTPTTQSSFSQNVADGAISSANTQKNTYGATVYTVGVFDGADASNPTSLPANSGSPARENRYMHLVSSNYPNAKSLTNTGNINSLVSDTQSYYLSASSTEALNAIFIAMGENVEGSTPVELGRETVVKDIITPQFTLPANTTDVTVKQVDCLTYNSSSGSATWDDKNAVTLPSSMVKINQEDHAVDVTGFDFAHNFVAEEARTEDGTEGERNFRGRKLVIVFTIQPDPRFLGGDNVKTNGDESGIYSKGVLIKPFNLCAVSVELKNIKTELTPKHIYLGNTVDLTGILDLYVDLTGEDQDIRIDVDGVFNAYVDLLYTIKLNDSTIATYYVPAGEVWGSANCVWTDTTSTSATALLQNYQALVDTSFEVTCKMTSVNNTSNIKETQADKEWVYVYKPTLTFQDSIQKYKETLNLGTDVNSFLKAHFTGVTWSHGSQTATPEGEAPEFAFDFTYSNTNAFTGFIMNSTQDVPVSVTVTIKGHHVTVAADGTVTSTDVLDSLWLKNLTRSDTDKITFAHATCAHTGCKFNSTTEEFIVHVINALTSLTIKKDGWKSADPNQTFLFRVTGEDADGKPINLTVTVHGNGSVTIYGLVIGNEYTVTELTDWSWRYSFKEWEHDVNKNDTAATDDTETASGTTNGATITIGEDGTITFTNGRTEEKWLDGDAWCDNLFKKKEENT